MIRSATTFIRKRTWPRNAPRRRDSTRCEQFPFSLILIGPEAVSGLKSSLKKMRFVELIVREVNAFIASIRITCKSEKTS